MCFYFVKKMIFVSYFILKFDFISLVNIKEFLIYVRDIMLGEIIVLWSKLIYDFFNFFYEYY